MQFTIISEPPDHQDGIEALMQAAFGTERSRRTVYRFRDGVAPVEGLSYVAIDARGHMLGSIRFWPVRLPGGAVTVLLGPLAVLPEIRGLGVGRALVNHGIDQARRLGYPSILIVGDPGYYAPFGFHTDAVQGLELPGPVTPLTFMGLEFTPGALKTLEGPVTSCREGG